ncbi:uncharacterized protein LOC143817301 [Ranitomeya variabilis]|uniref:uncharacterized protein LOC143817301 n=1 Tax=Ranitomeya variabilis TaxID=490064 RepID=UPI00405699CD
MSRSSTTASPSASRDERSLMAPSPPDLSAPASSSPASSPLAVLPPAMSPPRVFLTPTELQAEEQRTGEEEQPTGEAEEDMLASASARLQSSGRSVQQAQELLPPAIDNRTLLLLVASGRQLQQAARQQLEAINRHQSLLEDIVAGKPV